MGTKTIERERVRKDVEGDDFVVETYTEEVEVKVCDLCGNDEVALDGEFHYHTTLPASRLEDDADLGQPVEEMLEEVYVTAELADDASHTVARLFQTPLSQAFESEYRAAEPLSDDAGAYNVRVRVGPLPDAADDAADEQPDDHTTKLLCPACHDGLFGDDQ